MWAGKWFFMVGCTDENKYLGVSAAGIDSFHLVVMDLQQKKMEEGAGAEGGEEQKEGRGEAEGGGGGEEGGREEGGGEEEGENRHPFKI